VVVKPRPTCGAALVVTCGLSLMSPMYAQVLKLFLHASISSGDTSVRSTCAAAAASG